MARVTVAGLEIAFERAGTGPPLLLLHGGWSDHRAWRPQLEELADEFTVIAWAAPGCGRSADPPADFRLPDYADCVAGLVDALGLARPHMLGLSFGGGLALEVYRRHPAIVRTLVLAAAYAGWAGSLPPDVVEQRLARALREAELPPEQWADGYLPGMFAAGAPPGAVEEYRTMMLDARLAGIRAMLQGFAEADLRDVLPTIDVPTLLLYGAEDQRSPLSVAEDLHARIPTSRLVVIPDIGHVSNLEAPDVFNEEVRSFLHEHTRV
ncbi:alpha/beta fold hydrolase [Egibacter rhizosphaerae]|uniref:Alpha/beta fold hydrolase n=1 Tax=Egibacter rhizosphaerae TaxID=1670831 RepID=A0A411YFX2_9ACTN|nr:alpha/beta hydrolase [Egibacter rhizosphaerae]QBI20051.1 alpha/beta fold hydrolase [Egibacter rhizosphaerae]